jgi:hypothetical protein
MAHLARGYITSTQLTEIIESECSQASRVVKINCTFGEDWGRSIDVFWGHPPDESSRRRVFGSIASRVEDAIWNTIDPRNSWT